MSQRLYSFGFILLLMIALSPLKQAFADDDPKVYLVGIEDVDYLPFFTQSAEHSKHTFITDVLNLFAEEQGIKFEFVYLPISRFPDWYDSANIDFRVPDNALWSTRHSDLVYSDSIVNLHIDLVVLPDNQAKQFGEFERVGSVNGFTPSPQWKKRLEQNSANFVYDNSVKILVQLLQRGLVDCLDINLAVARYYGKQLGYPDQAFVVANDTPDESFSYHLSTRKHGDKIKLFNQFLKDEKSKIDSIKREYGISDHVAMK
ncbi:transporter substrate-binding domain-containing protein [Alteromonas facilis]|uniref:transporter substrate-binding domain-containing protein n=1 Tax=Alteromonas facilis TaxID=2048004 RepID=UPI000C293431|nr:transporter substrate-binding domain-containing protein [Alteromonas facilis]